MLNEMQYPPFLQELLNLANSEYQEPQDTVSVPLEIPPLGSATQETFGIAPQVDMRQVHSGQTLNNMARPASVPMTGLIDRSAPVQQAPVQQAPVQQASQQTAEFKFPVVGENFPEKALIKIVRQNESSGDYSAVNPHSSASGAYQYTDGTWNGYNGYSRALFAPPEVQDRRVKEDLANRILKYNGDPYKVIAAHYLPAFADNVDRWDESMVIHGNKVMPIREYVSKTIEGTPLEKNFEQYIQAYED